MTSFSPSPTARLGLFLAACLAANVMLHILSASDGYYILLFLPVIFMTAVCGALLPVLMILLDALIGIATGNPRVYFMPVVYLVVFATNYLTGTGLIRVPRKLLAASLLLALCTGSVEHALADALALPELGLPLLSPWIMDTAMPWLGHDGAAWLDQVVVQWLNIILPYALLYGAIGRRPALFPRCGRWKTNHITWSGHPLLRRLMIYFDAALITAAAILFYLLHQFNYSQLQEMNQVLAQDYVDAVAQMISPRRFPDILREGGDETDAYRHMVKQFHNFYAQRDSAVKYFYIYQVLEDGEGKPYIRVICDMEEGPRYGVIYKPDTDYARVLLDGRDYSRKKRDVQGPYFSESSWGSLISFYKPIVDSNGNVLAYVGLDMDRADLSRRLFRMDVQVLSLAITTLVLFSCTASFLIGKGVLNPLDALLSDNRYYREKGEISPSAPIRSGDEFEMLDGAMRQSLSRVIQDKKRQAGYAAFLHREAFHDSLTGVGNHTAYEKKIQQLDGDIQRGRAAFGVLMVDMNGLKDLNDRLGHEKGDIAIRAASRFLTRILGQDAVYRVGGDEFVAILERENYENRESRLRALAPALTPRDWKSTTPWEEVSFSAGLAVYDPGRDRCYGDVFNRADKNMYSGKQGR